MSWFEPLPITDLGPRKVAMFAYLHQWRNFGDSLVLCSFLPYSPKQMVEIVESVTGWNTSVWEGMKVGERAATMARAFNMIQGLTPSDDRLPPRMFEPFASGPLEGVAIDREAMDKAIRTYYKMMGWDPETGVPTDEKLEELGIGWVREKLRK